MLNDLNLTYSLIKTGVREGRGVDRWREYDNRHGSLKTLGRRDIFSLKYY